MRLDPTSETFPIAPTLQANDGAKWGSNQWVDKGKAIVERVAETLMATDHKGPGHNRDHNFVAQPVAFHANAQACQLPGPDRDTSISDSLTRSQQAAVAQPVATGFYPTAGQDSPCLTECSPSVKVGSGGSSGNLPGVQHAMQVRRLTPVECERLQGFPDNYTNIPWRNKAESPDGPRYKAMGNSMAVPVMRWIGERIAAVEAL
jgi:DNA (cytosine-5)-methyltransferase 1